MTNPWENEQAPTQTTEGETPDVQEQEQSNEEETQEQEIQEQEVIDVPALIKTLKTKASKINYLNDLLDVTLEEKAYVVAKLDLMIKEAHEGTIDLSTLQHAKEEVEQMVTFNDKEKESLFVDSNGNTSLALCNMLSQGMTMKQAKEKLLKGKK